MQACSERGTSTRNSSSSDTGRALGAAGVYPKQALVLVNLGGAQGEDVVRLARAIQADVKARYGVELEPEPVYI